MRGLTKSKQLTPKKCKLEKSFYSVFGVEIVRVKKWKKPLLSIFIKSHQPFHSELKRFFSLKKWEISAYLRFFITI
jgi:hypothetical protein